MKRSASIGWIVLLMLSLVVAAAIVVPVSAQHQSAQDQSAPVRHLHAHDSTPQEPVDGVYRVGHGVSAPRGTYMPDPEFSEQARQAGYDGICVLELVVDAEGMPRDIKVTHPVGMGLDEKAREAVRQWRFKPGMKDGEPVAVRINVETNFHLYGEGDKKPKLFQKANAGDAKAQFEIAQILLADPELASDDSKGFGFLEKAAKQGLPTAQFAMGEYLSSHRNDLVSAYVWYGQAARHHYRDSEARMKELGEKMTPEQLDEARRRVDSGNPF
jgi:TonB family protein